MNLWGQLLGQQGTGVPPIPPKPFAIPPIHGVLPCADPHPGGGRRTGTAALPIGGAAAAPLVYGNGSGTSSAGR